ncbi:hypothetical protein VNO77_41241 [Canavalia gladiata]|uniref:AP2/ERF domain-containing protein n=1 Tax=Canavalia gladiata TaxID=3824 RepID=A0AAN9PRY4_CANGL
MNIFKSSFDELMNYGTHRSEASSSSETSSIRTLHSDEEVILASTRPKKRAGRTVFKETRHPVYRGVRRRNKNRWVCEMRVPNNNSRIWLGTYPTPEMAARAHDVAALALRGKSACLNFADSAWRLTLPASTDSEEIRRAAQEAAQSFAAEDSQRQNATNVVDYEVCSVGDNMLVEDIANDDDKPLHQEEVYTGQVPAVPGFPDFHDLLLSIADEPLRSPPPCARDGGGWNDVDIFDAEMSLWNFSV